MTSGIATPVETVWASNGMVEALLIGLGNLARRAGGSDAACGAAIAEFTAAHRAAAGPGLYGFSVIAPPFDDPACRRLLARLVALLAHDVAARRADPGPLEVAWDPSDALGRCTWIAFLERVHDGVRASLPAGHEVPPLRVALEGAWRAAVDALTLQDRACALAWHRRQGRPGADPWAELALLDALSAKLRLAAGIFPPWTAPRVLADKAQLEESLGRLSDAAESWREVSRLEAEPAVAAVAAEIAADLERRAAS